MYFFEMVFNHLMIGPSEPFNCWSQMGSFNDWSQMGTFQWSSGSAWERLYEQKTHGPETMKKQLSDMIFGTNRITIRSLLRRKNAFFAIDEFAVGSRAERIVKSN